MCLPVRYFIRLFCRLTETSLYCTPYTSKRFQTQILHSVNSWSRPIILFLNCLAQLLFSDQKFMHVHTFCPIFYASVFIHFRCGLLVLSSHILTQNSSNFSILDTFPFSCFVSCIFLWNIPWSS